MRQRSFLLVALVVGLLLAATGGVYAYDTGRESTIARGVTVGGVDVGGLSVDRARVRLRAELLDPLAEPLVVRAGDRRFRLTAREARIRANVGAMVGEALEVSREGNLVTRTWRGLTGARVDRSIEPRVDYSRAAVGRLVDRVRVKSSRAPRDAEVSFSTASLSVKRSRTGRTVDAKALRRDVEAALLDTHGDRTLRAKLEKVKPTVTTAQLAKKYPTVITVDRGAYTLRLFKNLKQVKSYRIAVGKAGLETPAGLYSIQNKAVNPAWHVPNSDWAGDKAGQVIPPGPSNPLKSRWMGIYNGAGIHGTAERGSIGSNASHGCIRMLVEDVEDLFDRVEIGTAVYIA